ncbi:hypothetical protein IB286_12590 [Spongiibacter sp. KMU-158]|uniref:Uncharacterized protein n=1 Tax=Spongiibacter pelagi TaxID=2760804 RepID=A0A927C220_9GAMM|nr:hypothetical protein [Spongiibacter pelagi]MBD2859843.1 hypothetical protein [Spongiibacter pelagi]
MADTCGSRRTLKLAVTGFTFGLGGTVSNVIVTVVSAICPLTVFTVKKARFERFAIVTVDGTSAIEGCELFKEKTIGSTVGNGRLTVPLTWLPASRRESGVLKLNVAALAKFEKLIASTANSTDNALWILERIKSPHCHWSGRCGDYALGAKISSTKIFSEY